VFDSRQRQEIFLFSKTFKPALKPTHLPTPWVPGAVSPGAVSPGALPPGAKQPRREVNHSPPSSAEARNERSYTSAPPIRLHGVDEDNFTLVFLFNEAVGGSE